MISKRDHEPQERKVGAMKIVDPSQPGARAVYERQGDTAVYLFRGVFG